MSEFCTVETLFAPEAELDQHAQMLVQRYGWQLQRSEYTDGDPALELREAGLALVWRDGRQTLRLALDFVAGANAHRRKFGGGKGQAIAKACGVSAAYKPTIVDATAGQGGDAFVLASLGCRVTLLERVAVAHALLANALERAREQAGDDEALASVISRMTLVQIDAVPFFEQHKSGVDVVYLDPMFPPRKKSALVKKEMRAFHQVIGSDSDADALLAPALDCAKHRVVVKRPKGAPFLDAREPSYQLEGKSTRFDIYTLKAMP